MKMGEKISLFFKKSLQRYVFSQKDSINIKNINGRIEVESWGNDWMRFGWEKCASNEDFLDKIEIGMGGNLNEFTVITTGHDGHSFLGAKE